ncbi:hypothetical protein CDL12_25624 [Handroanthus impetiginosus]|uniref:Uncharacterized protein n=1 Tax=Handroanthus impetiginosus TaxID=429701 RepID=A0A2G9G989_9LAMI|nr:hypothetical protein CDL12_25624 [Handroanthus impetiginosus]
MQAIKEKLNDMSAMRRAKAEAKEEEKAEKEIAKARLEAVHEIRLAREAEAEMDHHVNKAAQKLVQHERKYPLQGAAADASYMLDSYGNPGTAYSTDPAGYGGAAEGSDPNSYGHHSGGIGSAAAAGNMPGGPPTHNNLL